MLQNWRRHGEIGARFATGWQIDFLSSAPSFDGFKDLDPRALVSGPRLPPLPVSSPRTWLLSVGWRRHGLVSVTEVPGPLPPAVARDGKRAMARR